MGGMGNRDAHDALDALAHVFSEEVLAGLGYCTKAHRGTLEYH